MIVPVCDRVILCSCRRTVPSPRPYDDASAEIFVLDFGLHKVSTICRFDEFLL